MVKELTANIATKITEEDSGTHRYVHSNPYQWKQRQAGRRRR